MDDRIEGRAPQVPTTPGFYWVRWCERMRTRWPDRYPDRSFVAEYVPRHDWMEPDEPDDPYPVVVTGTDVTYEIGDVEWIEGPLAPKELRG